MLSEVNSHERDKNIVFIPSSHRYMINNEEGYTSATTWVHSNFEPFDNDSVIDKMMNGSNWAKSPYFGLSKGDIKQKWAENGKESSGMGTDLHYHIEKFMNLPTGKTRPTHKDLLEEYYKISRQDTANSFTEIELKQVIEWGYFLDFVRKHPDFLPYRSEWMVYNEDIKICGTIDMVYENPDGSLNIFDWKRCKTIQKYSYGKTSLHPKMSKIPDSNYYHYLLQLSLYKYILETKYNKKVDTCVLVKLHPNNKTKSYEFHYLPNLGLNINELF
jgi:ATP-dependent exoDNAse (exonuclease V) beta subunit